MAVWMDSATGEIIACRSHIITWRTSNSPKIKKLKDSIHLIPNSKLNDKHKHSATGEIIAVRELEIHPR